LGTFPTVLKIFHLKKRKKNTKTLDKNFRVWENVRNGLKRPQYDGGLPMFAHTAGLRGMYRAGDACIGSYAKLFATHYAKP
jgi:hypothetical protein